MSYIDMEYMYACLLAGDYLHGKWWVASWQVFFNVVCGSDVCVCRPGLVRWDTHACGMGVYMLL